MLAVLFEVTIKKEHMGMYLAVAEKLKDELASADGFIRAERFSSLVTEGKLLSLSVWENEEAVENWRNQQQHRLGQRQGRDSIFESYTVTVLTPLRIYTHECRAQAPADSNEYFAILT